MSAVLGLVLAGVTLRLDLALRLVGSVAAQTVDWWARDSVLTGPSLTNEKSAAWALVPGTSAHGSKLKERCALAAELFHAGKVNKLLLSGDGRSRHYNEPAEMKRQLLALGVPAGALKLDVAGLSTYESVRAAQSMAGSARWIIVTQRVHAARAVLLSHGCGLNAVAVFCGEGVASKSEELREAKATVRAMLDLMGARALTESWEKQRAVSVAGMKLASL